VLSALALVWSTPLPVMIFVAATGLCFSGIFSLILAEAGERYPQFAGTVFGGVMAVGGVGGACFPWVIGALAETSVGWRGALVLVPVLAAGIAALMPLLAKPRR
jgi:fucose permease